MKMFFDSLIIPIWSTAKTYKSSLFQIILQETAYRDKCLKVVTNECFNVFVIMA